MQRNPIDALIDGILDRATKDGVFEGLPSTRELIAPYRSDAPPPPPIDTGDTVRRRNNVAVLRELLDRAEREMESLPGPRSRSIRATEVATLRLRLAAELQALRPRATRTDGSAA